MTGSVAAEIVAADLARRGLNRKEWKASDVRVSLTGSDIYFVAPCGETRFMSVVEAKALAKKITDLAQVWARS